MASNPEGEQPIEPLALASDFVDQILAAKKRKEETGVSPIDLTQALALIAIGLELTRIRKAMEYANALKSL